MLVRNPVQDWSVDDVQDWLKRNGFADYCTRFLLEEVDGPQMLTMSRRGLVLMGIEDSALLAAIHRLRDLKPRVGVISDRELNAVVTELNETIEWLVSRIPSDKMKKRVRQGLAPAPLPFHSPSWRHLTERVKVDDNAEPSSSDDSIRYACPARGTTIALTGASLQGRPGSTRPSSTESSCQRTT